VTKDDEASLLRTRGYVDSILPPIPPKRYFTIGEVSDLCAVKPHVLRYWEQEFPQLRPMKRRGNRRYYQQHEVLLIRKIRELLYDEGFTIQGARMRLTGRQTLANLQAEALAVARATLSADPSSVAPAVLSSDPPAEAVAAQPGNADASTGLSIVDPEQFTPDAEAFAPGSPGAGSPEMVTVAERSAAGVDEGLQTPAVDLRGATVATRACFSRLRVLLGEAADLLAVE
jgi:DNA-binding transcriptional MerR regulator